MQTVTALKNIPAKSRSEGAIVKLLWSDGKGAATRHPARIVKIGCDQSALDSIVLDERGKIVSSQKASSNSVLQEKKQLAKEKKDQESHRQNDSVSVQKEILKSAPLFSNPHELDTPSASSRVTEKDVQTSEAIFGPHNSYNQLSEGDLTNDEADEDDLLHHTKKNASVTAHSSTTPNQSTVGDSDQAVPAQGGNTSQGTTSDAVISQTTLQTAVKALMPAVTYENIVFLEKLLSVVKTVYESETKRSYKTPQTDMNIDVFKTGGEGKVPLYPNSQCFLPLILKQKFEKNATDVKKAIEKKSWKVLVRQVLVEVYGNQIVNYCAVGRSNSRPGLDRTIYHEVYAYASHFSGKAIAEEDYVTVINSIISNKRPKRRQTPVLKAAGKKPSSKPSTSNEPSPNASPNKSAPSKPSPNASPNKPSPKEATPTELPVGLPPAPVIPPTESSWTASPSTPWHPQSWSAPIGSGAWCPPPPPSAWTPPLNMSAVEMASINRSVHGTVLSIKEENQC